MRIQLLIAATLASLSGACSSTWNCHPPSEQFSVDATLTESEIAEIIESWGVERGDIACKSACSFVYQRDQGWSAGEITDCTLSVAPTPGATPETEVGSIQCEGTGYEYFCEGRRPLGHIEPASDPSREGPSLAAYLARCAHLEAASVVAFEELASVLGAANAPASLIERCHDAAMDERRHAAQVGALARSRGATPLAPEQRTQTATLAAIALDNAREGCVLETWSALRAAWIAEHAEDPELRRLYAGIAADEAAHAQLSWDLHAWLKGHVDAETGAKAESKLCGSLAALPAIAGAQAAISPSALGLCADVARVLAERFASALLSERAQAA